MAETKRQLQIAALIKRNFSSVLLQSGNLIYGDILVTVTSVKMTSDLGLAKIYLSVYGTENKQAVILMLEEQKRELRAQLAGRVRKHVRRIPDIDMYLDETLDEMYRLRDVFKDLRDRNQMGKEEE